MNNQHAVLAQRLGSIFEGKLQLEEVRYPRHASRARKLLGTDSARYGEIAEELLNGTSPVEVAEHFQLPADFVRWVSRVHPEIREVIRSEIVGDLESTLAVLARRLLREADQISPRDLPRAIATVNEQLALLCGGATTRIEHTTTVPSREKLLEMFGRLKDTDGTPHIPPSANNVRE